MRFVRSTLGGHLSSARAGSLSACWLVSVCSSACLTTCLAFCLSACTHVVYMYICMMCQPNVLLSVHLLVCLSVCLYAYLTLFSLFLSFSPLSLLIIPPTLLPSVPQSFLPSPLSLPPSLPRVRTKCGICISKLAKLLASSRETKVETLSVVGRPFSLRDAIHLPLGDGTPFCFGEV